MGTSLMDITIKGCGTQPYRVVGEFDSVIIEPDGTNDTVEVQYVNGEFVLYVRNPKIPLRIVA